MTGRIFPWPADPHREVDLLLPWYVTDRLDATDRAIVTSHLADCAACRDVLDRERRMARTFLAQEPTSSDAGWARMRARIAAGGAEVDADDAAPRSGAAVRHSGRRGASAWNWRHAIAAGQIAALFLVGLALWQQTSQPTYRVLGAQTASPQGNLLVIFKPDTPEQLLRQTLRDSGAQLVEGPTAANAYVVHVPNASRDAQLARLRVLPQVLLAEPVEPEASP